MYATQKSRQLATPFGRVLIKYSKDAGMDTDLDLLVLQYRVRVVIACVP
jgi:hypothetical protein